MKSNWQEEKEKLQKEKSEIETWCRELQDKLKSLKQEKA